MGRVGGHVRRQVQFERILHEFRDFTHASHLVPLERNHQNVRRDVNLRALLRGDVRAATSTLVLVIAVECLRLDEVTLERRRHGRRASRRDFHGNVNHALIRAALVSARGTHHATACVPAEHVVHHRGLLRAKVQGLLRVRSARLLEPLRVHAVEQPADVLVGILLSPAHEVFGDLAEGGCESADAERRLGFGVERALDVRLVLARDAESAGVARVVGSVGEVRGEEAGVVQALQRGCGETGVAAVGEAGGELAQAVVVGLVPGGENVADAGVVVEMPRGGVGRRPPRPPPLARRRRPRRPRRP